METINKLGNKQGVIKKKDFYISYINTSGNGAFSGDEDTETALCTGGSYFILNGDHRKEYAKCKTLKDAMKYFKSKPELKSSWSN